MVERIPDLTRRLSTQKLTSLRTKILSGRKDIKRKSKFILENKKRCCQWTRNVEEFLQGSRNVGSIFEYQFELIQCCQNALRQIFSLLTLYLACVNATDASN